MSAAHYGQRTAAGQALVPVCCARATDKRRLTWINSNFRRITRIVSSALVLTHIDLNKLLIGLNLTPTRVLTPS